MPELVRLEEESIIFGNKQMRERASDTKVEAYLGRCNLTRDTATNMTQFKGQPAICDLRGTPTPATGVVYCDNTKMVIYTETFYFN